MLAAASARVTDEREQRLAAAIEDDHDDAGVRFHFWQCLFVGGVSEFALDRARGTTALDDAALWDRGVRANRSAASGDVSGDPPVARFNETNRALAVAEVRIEIDHLVAAIKRRLDPCTSFPEAPTLPGHGDRAGCFDLLGPGSIRLQASREGGSDVMWSGR